MRIYLDKDPQEILNDIRSDISRNINNMRSSSVTGVLDQLEWLLHEAFETLFSHVKNEDEIDDLLLK